MSALHVVIGTGPLGAAVAHSLINRGQRVRVISRSGRPGPEGTEALAADVSTPDGATTAVAGASIVYQCAQPAYHRWAEEFPALQAAILDATASVGARLVLADNLYAYGDPEGAVIDENTPERATTKKGSVRRAMARDALAAHADGRLHVAITRPSNYFGPGYDQSGTAIFGTASRGKPMQFLGRGDQPRSVSFVPDAGAAMAAIGTSETGWGRIWITAMQPSMTQAEFGERVWRAAGQTGAPKFSYIGPGKLRLAAIFSPVVREVIEMEYEFDRPFVASAAAFESQFGMQATPLDEAIRATVQAYSPR